MPNHRTGKYLTCLNCTKEIYIIKSRLQKHERHFCSLKCVSVFTAPERSKKQQKKEYPFIFKNKCISCSGDIVVKNASFDKKNRKYCSKTCVTHHRNLIDNPTKREDVRMKISVNKTTHGDSKKPLFKVWLEIKRRCESTMSKQYRNYGGRGIHLSQEWHDFKVFEKWSVISGYIKGLTIERINVNGNYEEKNCTWIPFSEQSKNRRPSSEWNFKK